MPIVDLEIIADPGEQAPDQVVLQELANSLGDLFGGPQGSTWIKCTLVPRAQYVENGGGLPDGVQPVFARITRYQLPDVEERRSEAQELSRLIAGVLQRPSENVHIIYEPAGQGRIAFGGLLRE